MNPNSKSTPEEKENARENAKAIFQALISAEQRSANVGDEFIRLEVQIAAILFAFSGLFLEEINSIQTITGWFLILYKIAFTAGILFLLISLACGLLHLKNHEEFSGTMLQQRTKRYKKWCEVVQGDATFGEAQAFQAGSKIGDGVMVNEPSWTWILQTICLAIGVGILFLLATIFLFSQ